MARRSHGAETFAAGHRLTTCYRRQTFSRGESPAVTATSMGYCMKWKAQREMRDPEQVTMKNGRPATQGTCQVCGTKIFKIGAAK